MPQTLLRSFTWLFSPLRAAGHTPRYTRVLMVGRTLCLLALLWGLVGGCSWYEFRAYQARNARILAKHEDNREAAEEAFVHWRRGVVHQGQVDDETARRILARRRDYVRKLIRAGETVANFDPVAEKTREHWRQYLIR